MPFYSVMRGDVEVACYPYKQMAKDLYDTLSPKRDYRIVQSEALQVQPLCGIR